MKKCPVTVRSFMLPGIHKKHEAIKSGTHICNSNIHMTVTTEKTEIFERLPVPKAVRKLIIPTIMSSLVMVLYSLADTLFVGMLNDPLETGAVTLAAPVLLAFNAVNNLFGVGCASLISRSMGRKDYKLAKETGAFGFYCAIISGLLFSLLCTVFKEPLLAILGAKATSHDATDRYMLWTVTMGAVPSILNVVMSQLIKAEGLALHASLGAMSGCILNIILDPVFVLPGFLGMGAAGAGCATFISNCVACLYFIVMMMIKRGKIILDVKPSNFHANKKMIREICTVGVPASIQNLLNVTGMTVLNSFMSVYGAEAVSAIGIAHKLALLPMYIAMGISQGVMPLVGYNFASGNRRRMRDSVICSAKISLCIMLLGTAAFCIFSKDIISVFMKNTLVVSYGSAFLIAQSLAQPFLSVDFLGVGVFQACGMGRKSFIFAILRKIVLEIPALFVLGKLFPMYGLAWAGTFAEVILSVAAVLELKKILHVEE